MRKLILATAVGLCTAPVMAAPSAHPLLAHNSASASHTAASVPDLPLPPLNLASSLSLPGFGKGSNASTKPINLPGLGTINIEAQNPGKGNGTAKYAEQIDIDPDSSKTTTTLSTAYVIPKSGDTATATYAFSGAGFGKGSKPPMKSVTLPNLGTITTVYDNGGKGKTVGGQVEYTSPPLKY